MCYYRLTLGTLGQQGTGLADEKGAKIQVHKKKCVHHQNKPVAFKVSFPKNIEPVCSLKSHGSSHQFTRRAFQP